MYLFKYFVCLLSGFVLVQLSAQTPLHYLEHLSTKEGLSSNIVNDLTQDQNGFLWIATDNGLNRYDGTEILKYYANGDSGAIAGNTAYRLILLDSAHIVIATDKGLSILDTRNYTFENRFFSLDSAWSGYENQLLHLEKDTHGNIWIGTPVSVIRLDKNLNLQKVFRASYSSGDIGLKRIHYVFRIIPLASGEVLVWLASGLHIWSPATDTLIEAEEALSGKYAWLANSSYDQCFHVYDHYLFFLDSNKDSVVVYDELSGTRLTYDIHFGAHKKVSDIIQISQLSEGWIGISFTLEGMARIRLTEKGKTASLKTDTTIYFPKNKFGKFFQDREGNSWTISYSEGLLKIASGKQAFFYKELTQSGFDVESFLPFLDKILIASYGNGFYEWDQVSGELTHHAVIQNGIEASMVWNFSRLGHDSIWLGTQDGLFWYCIENNRLGRLREAHPSIMDSVAITCQFPDSHGLLWLGLGSGKGVAAYNRQTKRFRMYPNETGEYPYRYPYAIAEDNFANLWFVSDATAQLVKWNRSTGIFSKIIIPLFEGSNYGATGGLYLDRVSHQIWFGVSNIGLVGYNISTGTVKVYGLKEGLRSWMIFSILPDKTGTLWLATDQGISTFNPTTESFANYDQQDGLPGTYFPAKLYYDTARNVMYAGGSGGVVYFNPENVRMKKSPLHARITHFEINNLSQDIPESHCIELPWDKNDIAISFTAVNLTNGWENQYAYRLEAEDTTWNYLGSQRQIRFGSLTPGKYLFKVTAARGDRNWSPYTDTFQFTIKPPFVKTIWFYLLTIAFFGSLIYIWYRYRLSHIMRLQNMRARISQDLHDDIGARLTNIGLITQIARGKEEKGSQKDSMLAQILDESQSITQSMSEIIWNINPENDSMEMAIPMMLRYISNLLENKRIVVNASLDNLTDAKLDMEQRRDLFLILKEAAHNIVRHARATQVLFLAENFGRAIRFQLTDDGQGFDLLALQRKSGLISMQKRAHKHRWRFIVNTQTGNGTTVILEIPLKKFGSTPSTSDVE